MTKIKVKNINKTKTPALINADVFLLMLSYHSAVFFAGKQSENIFPVRAPSQNVNYKKYYKNRNAPTV